MREPRQGPPHRVLVLSLGEQEFIYRLQMGISRFVQQLPVAEWCQHIWSFAFRAQGQETAFA